MPTSTRKNGITLIALIITIIVMLILVGVTINVALNGGLFEKAREARNLTNLRKDQELIQSVALGYLDDSGKVDFDSFDNLSETEIVEGYTLTQVQNGKYVQATKGDNIFYVDENGGIHDSLDIQLSIWQQSPRNMNITKCIIGKEYEFEELEYNSETVNVVVTFTNEGTIIIGYNGINGSTDPIPSSNIDSYILNDPQYATAEGDIASWLAFPNEGRYITFIFNGDTADVYYKSTTLGGTDGVHAVTKAPGPSVNQYGFYNDMVYKIDLSGSQMYFYFPSSNYSKIYVKIVTNGTTTRDEIEDIVIYNGGKTYILVDETTKTFDTTVIEGDNFENGTVLPWLNVLQNGNLQYIGPTFNQNGIIKINEPEGAIAQITNDTFASVFTGDYSE